MLFDTDVLIWVERGHQKAAALIDSADEKQISAQSYMELLQGARSQKEMQVLKSFLNECGFEILPLTENIGYRAAIYIEEYSVASGVRVGDAIIAATAVEKNLILCTSNHKHFKAIRDLQLNIFKP